MLNYCGVFIISLNQGLMGTLYPNKATYIKIIYINIFTTPTHLHFTAEKLKTNLERTLPISRGLVFAKLGIFL